jgi:hypothetical protein
MKAKDIEAYRHSRESGNPAPCADPWIPAFAEMTGALQFLVKIPAR